MWIVSTCGFFSIVTKPGDAEAGVLTVRARQRGDMERLKAEYLPSLGPILESRVNDYRFRAKALRGEVADAVGRMVAAGTYGNFKDEVRRVQGPAREAVYHRVWEALYALQKP